MQIGTLPSKKKCKCDADTTNYFISFSYYTMLTPKEAKLITLGLNVEKYKKLNEKQPKLFSNSLDKAIENYFELRFELNRELLEQEWVCERIEKWWSPMEAEDSLQNPAFNQFALDLCLVWLDLV